MGVTIFSEKELFSKLSFSISLLFYFLRVCRDILDSVVKTTDYIPARTVSKTVNILA